MGLGMLVTDGRVDISELKEHEPPAEFVQAVIDELDNGPITWDHYRTLAEEHDAKIRDLHALILRKDLIWSLAPFRLSSRAR
jgi:hypothetical protein